MDVLGERQLDRLGAVRGLGDDLAGRARVSSTSLKPRLTIAWSSATRIRVTSGMGISGPGSPSGDGDVCSERRLAPWHLTARRRDATLRRTPRQEPSVARAHGDARLRRPSRPCDGTGVSPPRRGRDRAGTDATPHRPVLPRSTSTVSTRGCRRRRNGLSARYRQPWRARKLRSERRELAGQRARRSNRRRRRRA